MVVADWDEDRHGGKNFKTLEPAMSARTESHEIQLRSKD